MFHEIQGTVSSNICLKGKYGSGLGCLKRWKGTLNHNKLSQQKCFMIHNLITVQVVPWPDLKHYTTTPHKRRQTEVRLAICYLHKVPLLFRDVQLHLFVLHLCLFIIQGNKYALVTHFWYRNIKAQLSPKQQMQVIKLYFFCKRQCVREDDFHLATCCLRETFRLARRSISFLQWFLNRQTF